MGRALLESILFMDGRCIVSAIDRKTMDFYNAKPGRKIMDVIGMAKDGMASDEMVEYIKDNLAIEKALS